MTDTASRLLLWASLLSVPWLAVIGGWVFHKTPGWLIAAWPVVFVVITLFEGTYRAYEEAQSEPASRKPPGASARDLGEILEITPQEVTFQPPERPTFTRGTRLTFACRNRDAESLMNCSARLDELLHEDSDGSWVAPPQFTISHLPWELGERVNLAPGETGVCCLMQHEPRLGIGVHIGGDPINYAFKDGRYRATITWRAEHCRPVVLRFDFEAQGHDNTGADPGILKFVREPTP